MTPLNLNLDQIYEFASPIKLVKGSDYRQLLIDYCISGEKLASALALADTFALARAFALAHADVHAEALVLALADALADADDLADANTLALANALANTLARADARARANVRARALADNFADTLARAYRVRASPLARIDARTCVIANTLADALAFASVRMFDSARVNDQTSSFCILPAQLLANLSICVCICSYELWSHEQSYSSSRSFWKRWLAQRRQEMPALSRIQETLDQGVEIYERLKRLDRRIKGEEHACEGILIVKERK